MSEFINAVRQASDGSLTGVSDAVILALIVVGGLLVIASIVALAISIFLAISYIKYNRRQNSAGKTGEEIARTILDRNGLQKIRVSKNGSILFGNSYSHYFKKVRLRRLTWQKKSVTSLAMAAQKSSLAVMDKENDPDMRKLVRLTPLIYLGPPCFCSDGHHRRIAGCGCFEKLGCCLPDYLFGFGACVLSRFVRDVTARSENREEGTGSCI